MPFSTKYNNLGTTEKMRIPKSQLDHIETLLNYYNKILEKKDNEYLKKLQQGMIDVLEKASICPK